MKPNWWTSLLFAVFFTGCVTQTERIPYHRYYDPPENESVLDELRREFGWQKPSPWVREEPFFTRAARGMKETVSGWFPKDESPHTLPGQLQTMKEFQKAQQEAIQRLQQRNTDVDAQAGQSSGSTNNSLTPDPGVTRPEQ
ncbi:MAG: hypothetical protein FJ147_17060 [Deltaproteobacteria bacterium]|nr:hypothetical protein [Deltaproteobacteria bacterium]